MRQSQSSPTAAHGLSNYALVSLVESSDDAIICKTLEGIVTAWNKAAENIYGYAAEEMLGRSISLLIPPDRPDELPRILARLKRGESLKRFETVRLRKNGDRIDISLTISPIKNAAGKTVAASVIARDISQRKRDEAALQKSAAEFRAVFEHAGIGIALVGANGELVRCNLALQQMLGYTEDELGHLNFKDFTHPDDLGRAASLFLRLMEGKLDRYQTEKRYIRKDGSVIWGRLTASVVRTRRGEAKYCVGMVEDVTSRKQAEDQLLDSVSERNRTEAALQKREAEYRAIFEHAGIAIVLVDEPGQLICSNPAFQQMMGYTEDEVRGVDFRKFTHPLDLEKSVSLHLQLVEGKLDRYQFDKRLIRKDGNVIWVRLTASVVRTREGEAKLFVGMAEDITAQRKLEEQFNQAQKMEAVGRLAGGVAHDFNNHLNVIMGYACLLERDTSPDKVRESAGEILKAAERASSLTRQLLAFSRKQTVQLHTVDLNAVLAETSSMLRRLIGEDIEVNIRAADDSLFVRAGTGQIEQVIMNLAVNARDAMPHGGQLTIGTSKAELDHDVAGHLGLCAGTYSVLRVSDNGHGMDARTKAHLFEPFFTTKEPGKGTGLGLATVHGIVTQGGGSISVDSTVNVGTTFTIYLPLAPQQTVDVVRTPPVVFKTAARGSETILLVEDQVSLRRLTKQLLQTHGYNILEAEDGTSALKIAASYSGSIQLLVTDVIMPGMHGRDVAIQVRQHRPGLKVLYITGYADTDLTSDERTSVLEKPFTPDALLRKVHEILAPTDDRALAEAG